ncbi:MAG: hypothetical protein RLZZ504_1312, partial [Bacteroidota bacterium]
QIGVVYKAFELQIKISDVTNTHQIVFGKQVFEDGIVVFKNRLQGGIGFPGVVVAMVNYLLQRIGCLSHSANNNEEIVVAVTLNDLSHIFYALGIFYGCAAEFEDFHC